MNHIKRIKDVHQALEKQGRFFVSRRKARLLWKKHIKKKGYLTVDQNKINLIKAYSKETFGSSSFWPWLALYTEVRGKFKEGWLPNDLYRVVFLGKYNPESLRISDYKSLDYKMFPDFAIAPVILKVNNNYFDEHRRQITVEEGKKILYDYDDEVVLKEDLGFGGRRITFIESKKLDLEKFVHIPSFIIQPVINQHQDLKLLSPTAVSTLRVLTFVDDEGNIDVKYTYLRFGVGDSRVDNVSSGGGSCFVLPNGCLDELAYDLLGLPIGNRHPDTRVQFASFAIPCHQKITEKCITSHKMFPYARFIGWDVTVDTSGTPLLLEWNMSPLIWLPEALNGPFFKEDFKSLKA